MRAAIYVRVSSAGQATEDKVSLPEQARELREIREARGWQTVEPPDFRGREALPEGVFGDPGITGDTVEGRPGMVALLEAVKAGQVDAVLVRDINRLARSELASQQIHEVFEAHGVALVTPAMEYDYGNLQHRLMLGLLGSIEAYAKRWLVQNLRRARLAKAADGKFTQRMEPYGYRMVKVGKQSRPSPVLEEIEIVREVFRLSIEDGLSANAIAEVLRQRRIPTRSETVLMEAKQAGRKLKTKAGVWREAQVRNILRGRWYIGEWATLPARNGKPEVLAKDPPAPAVDAETFRKAQASLAFFRRNRRFNAVKREFLLSGLIYCHCGSAMTGRSPQMDYAYYGCNKGVRSRKPDGCNGGYCPARGIEEACWGLVEELAANPAAVALYADRTEQQELPRWRREIKRAQKALGDLDFEEELAARAYRKGVNTLERYEKDLAEIRQERTDLTATAERLTRLVGDAEAKAATVDRVREIVDGFADRLDTLTMSEKRALLKRLMFRVTITPDEGNSQAKRGQRRFDARIEWAGEVFARSETPVSSMPTMFRRPML